VALFLGSVGLFASDPVGVYGIIDRVAVTPAADGSATAQIWGSFVVAVAPPSRSYAPEEAYGKVSKGYLLYHVASFKGSTAEAEWNDLRRVAGTGTIVGFGDRWKIAPRVRPSTESPAKPDDYTLNFGVVSLGKYGDYPTIAAALEAAGSPK